MPDTNTFPGADYYEIAVVEYQEQMHSDLPPTTLRGYVQLETGVVPGEQFPLQRARWYGTPNLMPDGNQAFGVDNPHYLGPTIVATKDRAVRITFYNLLPTGAAGDLFLPVDSTVMGSGMGPDGHGTTRSRPGHGHGHGPQPDVQRVPARPDELLHG